MVSVYCDVVVPVQEGNLVLSENCYEVATSNVTGIQFGLFYAEFCAQQNKFNNTFVALLARKLQHLLKIAFSRR